MASTTSMFTALSGLTAHSRRLETIGNNIANANTHGFKASRALFATHFSRTLSMGSAPAEAIGGTNPTQIGHGVLVAGTQKDFRTGSISATGDPRDLAIDGRGFFMVERGPDVLYTRVGAFRQDQNNDLVTVDGDHVLGFAVDDNYNLQENQLVGLNIPIGTLTVAQATQNVRFAGNLNASGAVATSGSHIQVMPSGTQGFSLVPSATVQPAPGNIIETTSLLTELADPQSPASPLVGVGQIIEVRGAEKGERTLPAARLAVTAASTMQDLLTFFTSAFGLNQGAPNAAGPQPGAAINGSSGVLSITGNSGAVNDLTLDPANIRILSGDGQLLRTPFATEKSAAAEGESVRTTFVAYDSLGTPVSVDLSFVLEGRDEAGTFWRYSVDSIQGNAMLPALGSGVVRFDSLGQLEGPAQVELQVPRDGTGAENPLTLTLNFAQGGDRLTALTSGESHIASTYQDGAPMGTLAAFGVEEDGLIRGSFTNGITRTLGRIPTATFVNPEGLIDEGGNLFRGGPNSGQPTVVLPGTLGSGRLVSGALELSNVDLGHEFINMILTSTGYSASSRIIRTSDELLQQLMLLGR